MYSGVCLKRLRAFREIKQETVAKRLGISQQAYSKLENCEHIAHDRLNEILRAMGSTIKDLEKIVRLYPPPPAKSRIVPIQLCSVGY
jgi:transcriptional regulator with XRE-family HTH domain